jgi:SAM-dependent methyltransferase
MSEPLRFTGERFIPGAQGEIWYEHWHRYHFAATIVAGRDVLDIACGEGYGSALLARHGARVTGGDISPEAIAHARAAYGALANLEFREADCTSLPFPAQSFDAVVSFETIEHIAGQETFLAEIRRVLRPGGLVILSCPNRVEYTDKRCVTNEFHVREHDRDELAALIAPKFAHAAWYGQRPSFYSVIWPEAPAAQGEVFEVGEKTADAPTPGHGRPLYFIVVASESADSIAAVVPLVSVLADRDEWIYQDYGKVTRMLDAAHRRGNALEHELRELAAHHAEAVRQRDALQTKVDAERGRNVEREQELVERDTLRWWLAFPWRRLRGR